MPPSSRSDAAWDFMHANFKVGTLVSVRPQDGRRPVEMLTVDQLKKTADTQAEPEDQTRPFDQNQELLGSPSRYGR